MVNELNKCSECTQCPVFETMVSMHVCQQCTNMPRLSNLDRARAIAIGQLEAGVKQSVVAARFGVGQSTISKLKTKFRNTGDEKDGPKSGIPRITTHRVDRME